MKKAMKLVAQAFVLAGLIGCQGSFSNEEPLVATHYIKSKPHYQKPGAAIDLVNSQVSIDASGVQYAIDLDIDSNYSRGTLELSVSTSKGLYIVDGATEIEQTLVNGSMTFPYTIIASEVGRYYLNAKVKIEDRHGRNSFRALTLIVQVGEETSYTEKVTTVEKSNTATEISNKAESSNSGALIVMPAEEKIVY